MGWDGGIEPKIAAGCEIEKTFVEPSYLPSSSRRKMSLLWIQNRLSLNTEQCFLRFWLKLTFVTLVYKSIRMLFTGFAEKKRRRFWGIATEFVGIFHRASCSSLYMEIGLFKLVLDQLNRVVNILALV